ncbi:MAG: hypothetical protein LKE40_03640 [Spirochaetia bacterium]|jgi:UDP:flavonoid glycosyltransferase YjiC (YdhE family)|nr:hypothetical protein [Spirochaetia bacterium]
MNILIVPMVATAGTSGPASRARLFAEAFQRKGMNVAICTDEKDNFNLPGIKRHSFSDPVPLGLPELLGRHIYAMADRLGVIGKKSVHSFEEALHLTGTASYAYLKHSIIEIQQAIKDFATDVLYAEFSIPALIAAKAEGKPAIASFSFSTQPSYASTPRYAKDVNRVLAELKLHPVSSTLDLFLSATMRIIPTSQELEPMDIPNTYFVGSLKQEVHPAAKKRNCILVYMDNGAIAQRKLLQTIEKAFANSSLEVYVAGIATAPMTAMNIHIAQKFDFANLLPRTAVFINHGGQNSIIDGLLNSVPQLVCPGKVFERKYNAQSIAKYGAGIFLDLKHFRSSEVASATKRLLDDDSYRKHAKALANSLLALGGANTAATYISNRFSP